MVRHPLAYPALNLSHSSITSKKTLVDSPQVSTTEEGSLDCSRAGSTDAQAESSDPNDHRDNDRRYPKRSGVSNSATDCTEALAHHLQIDYWTSVSVTNRYAASTISTYLATDHTMLRLFDAMAFLNDLIYKKSTSCSPFLVNSLLAFASQTYSTMDPTAAGKSLEFEKEARILWRADSDDSPPNIAGHVLLYLSMANNGTGYQGAASYISEAGEMAKRMQLFGVHDRITTLEPYLMTDEAQYAFEQAAWGVFNVLK